MITSTSNPKIKAIRALQAKPRARQEAGQFVVEGVRLVEDTYKTGWQIRQVFYTRDLNARGQAILKELAGGGAELEPVAPHVLKFVSDTQTPQGLLAVVDLRRLPTPAPLSFVLILDAVRDPGNLGTILRSAAAAGVDAVLLSPGCVDPFAPKVLRAGMGAQLRLPVFSLPWREIRQLVEEHQLRAYLADAGAGLLYTQVDFEIPCALILGGEAHGEGNEAVALARSRVRIPMQADIESLNAAMAATVLLFEAVRQRAENEQRGERR